MRTKMANKPDAVNPAVALLSHAGFCGRRSAAAAVVELRFQRTHL
jgi:hypothetical protein